MSLSAAASAGSRQHEGDLVKGFFVIAGLGNPGRRYAATRHNAGFRVVDLLAERLGAEFTRRRFDSLLAEAGWNGRRLLLVKPQTYMNRSGPALAELVRYLRVELERLAVVHDDVDLEPGRLQLRRGGGSGGHRGLESLRASLGSGDFVRLRLGVGRPPPQRDTADWVLEPPDAAVAELLAAAERRAVDALECWLEKDLTTAMNRYNPWPVREESP